jgi:hypothetical protein
VRAHFPWGGVLFAFPFGHQFLKAEDIDTKHTEHTKKE